MNIGPAELILILLIFGFIAAAVVGLTLLVVHLTRRQ